MKLTFLLIFPASSHALSPLDTLPFFHRWVRWMGRWKWYWLSLRPIRCGQDLILFMIQKQLKGYSINSTNPSPVIDFKFSMPTWPHSAQNWSCIEFAEDLQANHDSIATELPSKLDWIRKSCLFMHNGIWSRTFLVYSMFNGAGFYP